MSSDSDTTTTSLFKALLNEGARKCYNIAYREALIETATDLTEASTGSYPLPARCGKIDTVKVAVGSYTYAITEFSGSEDRWNILIGDGTTTDYPQYFRQKANTIEFYPAFSSADLTFTYRYKRKIKDMSADDHTTGTIKTATNGSTAIVGNTGTAWTSAMAGRYLKITGDEDWYQIASVTDATNLVLSRQYVGTSIAAGTTAYTIGEMNLLDEAYQDTPIFYALYFYYLQKENTNMANTYFNLLPSELRVNLLKEDSSETVSGILSSEDPNIINPADYPTGLTAAS